MNKLILTGLKVSSNLLDASPKLAKALGTIRNASNKCYTCKKKIDDFNACKNQKPKPKKPRKPFKSMWYLPLCKPTKEICPMPSFDELYYKSSDKTKRVYQQTWINCPRVIREVVVCDPLCADEYMEIERRPKRVRGSAKQIAKKCKKQVQQCPNCPRLRLPGCKMARPTYMCDKERFLSDCKPPKAPFPCYSECQHPKIKPVRPHECECCAIRSLCEVYSLLRKKCKLY